MQQVVVEPQLYFAKDHIFDLHFHPAKDFLACSLITGQLNILHYSEQAVTQVRSFTNHKDSCRSVSFSPAGQTLASGGKDKRIALVDAETQKSSLIKNSHKQGVNRVKFVQEGFLVSGDDVGEVKVWDLRNNSPVLNFKSQEQTITGLCFKQNFLMTTSLDGTLAVYDTNKGSGEEALYALSDNMQEDLMGCQLVNNGKFVAVNSSQGVILLFKWDWFGDCKDRILGHPNSIDAMLKFDEKTLITGAQDGFARAVGLFPNRVKRIIGQHQEQQNYPITRLGLSHDKMILGSLSHDQSLKFYQLSKLRGKQQAPSSDSQVQEQMQQEQQPVKRTGKVRLKQRQSAIKKQKRSKFFNDL